MIPVSHVEGLKAAPRRVLVRRDEVAERLGQIWLPAGYRSHTRKAVATVFDVDIEANGWGFNVGDRVILSPSAGKKLLFGYTKEEQVELWSVPPQAILAVIFEQSSPEYGVLDQTGKDDEWISRHAEPEAKFDEGDPRGLK